MKKITEYMWNVVALGKRHKVITTVVLIVLVVAGYYGYKKINPATSTTRYVLGTVERGTLISSVSGTGQVSASNQIDIKPKASGEITSVQAVAGQEVRVGAVIATIDSRDAFQSVRDAEADLTSAKISLQKTQTSSVDTRSKASDTLKQSYESAYNTIASAYATFSEAITDVDDIFYTVNHSPYIADESIRSDAGSSGVQRKNDLVMEYERLKVSFAAAHDLYKTINRQSDPAKIETLLAQTYTLSQTMSDEIKSIRSFETYLESAVRSVTTAMTSDIATLDSDLSSINSAVVSLQSAQSSISNAKSALASANETYSTISGSSEPLDVQTARLTVTQKQNAYQKALNTLSDYTVRAPFDGVVAAVTAKKGDTVSSGTSLGTLITKQKIATVSLNEIDVAKVAVGQKATLTFDAFPDLTISGQVSEVDLVGAVSQGVVSYSVKIGFDTQDDRIKSGMSVSTSIITDSKADVLMVPSGAIKTDTNGSYALVPVGNNTTETPIQVGVEVGATNDSNTEILSGLTEGEQIVTRTVTGAAATTQTTTRTSGTGILGVPTGGSGNARFTR